MNTKKLIIIILLVVLIFCVALVSFGIYVVSSIEIFPPNYVVSDCEFKLDPNSSANTPISLYPNSSVLDALEKNSFKAESSKPYDFVIIEGMQKGLYSYATVLPKIEPGKIYLKAFETNTNKQLSEEEISKDSIIEVENTTNDQKLYFSNVDFTIYECDWNQPYEVRFELWYQNNTSKENKKLSESNFIIEGWMR